MARQHIRHDVNDPIPDVQKNFILQSPTIHSKSSGTQDGWTSSQIKWVNCPGARTVFLHSNSRLEHESNSHKSKRNISSAC